MKPEPSNSVKNKALLPQTPEQENIFFTGTSNLILKIAILKMLPFITLTKTTLSAFTRHPLSVGVPITLLAYFYKSAKKIDDQYYLRSKRLH